MTHPLEQLAPYVDGALDQQERAVVDAHLRSCERCRREVATATRARAAILAIPDAPVPDIAGSFTPERIAGASHQTSARRPASPWAKVAPALAAAAVVALVALVAPRIGGGAGDQTAADAGGVETALPEEDALRLEIANTDYDHPSLEGEAAAFADQIAGGGHADQAAVGAEASAAPASGGAMRVAGPAPSARAKDCLRTAFIGHPGDLVRIRRATFEGTPAYLGYALERPGAGQPASLVSIWVAAVDDCSIVTFTSAKVDPAS